MYILILFIIIGLALLVAIALVRAGRNEDRKREELLRNIEVQKVLANKKQAFRKALSNQQSLSDQRRNVGNYSSAIKSKEKEQAHEDVNAPLILDPLNPLNPLSPVSPFGINMDEERHIHTPTPHNTPSHSDHSSHSHDHGSSHDSGSYDSGSSYDSSSYDSGSSGGGFGD